MNYTMTFLCYKIPNREIQIQKGKWEKSNDSTKQGFIISDADGEIFWHFNHESDIAWNELPLIHCSNCNLPAISEKDYLSRAEKLISAMREKEIEKVVYSRIKVLPFDASDFKTVFNTLCQEYPNNLNYCFNHPELGCWMGSTPEILIQGSGNQFKSMALAGTLPSDAPDSDWTEKEYEEQLYVSAYLKELIGKHGHSTSESERYVVQAGPVKHLRNDFEFTLVAGQFWDFVTELHPTPAVCGVPKEKAKLLYQNHEAHHRSLYTGIIGFVDEGDCTLYVNLRCMQLFKYQAALYVGGGFTIDSNPHKEWLETERKADTLAKFLTIDK